MDRRKGYGQYCPIVRAVEVLGERWSLLIVRDLLVGTSRFNDLSRGLPGLSRSLLSKRLRALQVAGIVERSGDEYVLTPAGLELEPIVFGLGEWGARWTFGEPREDELDPELLLWWAHGQLDRSVLPAGRLLIAWVLREPAYRAWFLLDDAGVSMCKSDPGFEVDATVSCTVRTLAEVWLGRRPLDGAIRSGDLSVVGDRPVVAALPGALRLSPVAPMVAGSLSDR